MEPLHHELVLRGNLSLNRSDGATGPTQKNSPKLSKNAFELNPRKLRTLGTWGPWGVFWMIDSRLPRLASQLARLKRSHRYSPANYSSVCLAPFSQPVLFWFGEDKAGKNVKMVYLRYGHLYFWKLLRLGALKGFFFWSFGGKILPFQCTKCILNILWVEDGGGYAEGTHGWFCHSRRGKQKNGWAFSRHSPHGSFWDSSLNMRLAVSCVFCLKWF